MRLALEAASVRGVLPPTSTAVESGRVAIVVAATELGPTVLSLIAGGRMTVDSGTVSVSDTSPLDPRAHAAAVALVDTPSVAEPPASVRLATVVSEELALAGRSPSRRAVRAFLDGLGAGDIARTEMGALPPAVRLTVLGELAALRPGVLALVITSPERHGGPAREWLAVARRFADHGLAVLVVTSASAAASAVSRPRADLVSARSTRVARRTYVAVPRPMSSESTRS